MFTHLVTAAKGLFTRKDSDKTNPISSNTPTTTSKSTIRSRQKMVTATRRRTIGGSPAAAEKDTNTPVVTNGKRKSQSSSSAKPESQPTKRRKRGSLESAPESEDESTVDKVQVVVMSEPKLEEKSAPSAKKNHFRFDSEEPELPVDTGVEEAEETRQNYEHGEDSSDDDDAPEAIDNSAQLSKIRVEAKRLERAKQIEEQLKKEKRKQLDDLRKSQAKSSNKTKEALTAKPKPADDLLSESTETLQGSVTQDVRRSALPALLPDDILNAAPVTRPLTPPAEEIETTYKKPTKLRFLEKTEKRPKDVKIGDVTIRVLDEDVAQKKAKTSLPPKTSKTGRNAKQNWLNRSRSTGGVNGLRRTTGGTSGFVRR